MCFVSIVWEFILYFEFVFIWILQVENVILELNKTFPEDGLLPIYINPHRETKSHATITFGAMGDRYWMSYYSLYSDIYILAYPLHFWMFLYRLTFFLLGKYSLSFVSLFC